MNRTIIAFAVAPLAVPVLLVPYLWSMNTQPGMLVLSLEIGVVFAYFGCFVFGVPAYLFLAKRGWTAFWIAPSLGFVAGAVAWIGFAVLFPLLLETGIAGMWRSLRDPATLKGMVWPGGVLGAAVGVLLWLIARPDQKSAEKRIR